MSLHDAPVAACPADAPGIHFADAIGAFLAEQPGQRLIAEPAPRGERIIEMVMPVVVGLRAQSHCNGHLRHYRRAAAPDQAAIGQQHAATGARGLDGGIHAGGSGADDEHVRPGVQGLFGSVHDGRMRRPIANRNATPARRVCGSRYRRPDAVKRPISLTLVISARSRYTPLHHTRGTDAPSGLRAPLVLRWAGRFPVPAPTRSARGQPEGDRCCPHSICVSCSRLAFISATRAIAGTERWRPIFGARNNIHIIDLAQTVPLFHQALVKVADVVPDAAACCSSAPSARPPRALPRLPSARPSTTSTIAGSAAR